MFSFIYFVNYISTLGRRNRIVGIKLELGKVGEHTGHEYAGVSSTVRISA